MRKLHNFVIEIVHTKNINACFIKVFVLSQKLLS